MNVQSFSFSGDGTSNVITHQNLFETQITLYLKGVLDTATLYFYARPSSSTPLCIAEVVTGSDVVTYNGTDYLVKNISYRGQAYQLEVTSSGTNTSFDVYVVS